MPSCAAGHFSAFAKPPVCYFLTVSVPDQQVPEGPEQFRDHLYFNRHSNPSVTTFAPSEWASFVLISGGCSCDLIQDDSNATENRERIVQRHRKKGWSEAKISRAIGSRKTAEATGAGLRSDALEVLKMIVDRFEMVRVSLHWYSGDIETEKFVLRDVGAISTVDLTSGCAAIHGEETLLLKRGERDAGANGRSPVTLPAKAGAAPAKPIAQL